MVYIYYYSVFFIKFYNFYKNIFFICIKLDNMDKQYQQLQLLKKKYENMSDTALALTSPYLFFVKIEPNMEKNRYIYWFAYCMGKVNSMLWGVYKTKKKQYSIKGVCKFSLGSLNDAIKLKKEQGFILVSAMAKDNITPTFKKYLDKETHSTLFKNKPINLLEFLLHQNRGLKDLFTPFNVKEENYLYNLSQEFLDYVERNLVLFEKAEKLCAEKENCPIQTSKFEDFSCDLYYYGTPNFRFKKSIEDEEDDEDDLNNIIVEDEFVSDLT